MIPHQERLKKTFNQKVPRLKTDLDEHQPGFYCFLKVKGFFISKKINQKNENLKRAFKKTNKKLKSFLLALIHVYYILIKQKNLKKLWFLSKISIKKLFQLIKKNDVLKNNIGCFALPKKT